MSNFPISGVLWLGAAPLQRARRAAAPAQPTAFGEDGRGFGRRAHDVHMVVARRIVLGGRRCIAAARRARDDDRGYPPHRGVVVAAELDLKEGRKDRRKE